MIGSLEFFPRTFANTGLVKASLRTHSPNARAMSGQSSPSHLKDQPSGSSSSVTLFTSKLFANWSVEFGVPPRYLIFLSASATLRLNQDGRCTSNPYCDHWNCMSLVKFLHGESQTNNAKSRFIKAQEQQLYSACFIFLDSPEPFVYLCLTSLDITLGNLTGLRNCS